MNVNRQRLISITFGLLMLVGLGVAGVSVFTESHAQHANADASFPRHYFAPYTEIGVGDSLKKAKQTTGQKYFTLAFAISHGSDCRADYPAPIADIAYIRSQGGDVIQSFGGAAGKELAQTCTSASSLQAQYQSVVTKLGLTHLDFDIEGGQEGDASTYRRRNAALAALQHANPGLTISFTLPATPTGLESGSIGLLKDAVSKGVNFNIVNLMTMDYGSPQSNMGQQAINGATGLANQLKQIFPKKTESQRWDMVGITALIGHNDEKDEIFNPGDAEHVLSFAKTHQIGELSFWALSRDNGSCPGSTASSDTCDGLAQSPYAFTNSWKTFTNGSSNGDSTPGNTLIAIKSTPGSDRTDGQKPVVGQAYNIFSKLSGKALDVKLQSKDSGARILQWSWVKGQSNQQWTLTSAGTGYYYIVNKRSGKVLDDTDWVTTDGDAVQQWTNRGQADQQWSLIPAGNGYYYIKNRNSGKVLDVTDWSTKNGGLIQQWTLFSGHDNQKWRFQTA